MEKFPGTLFLSQLEFFLIWSVADASMCSHLDDGVRIDMKPGDVCVQRGTIHGWTNYSDEPARLYFVLSGEKAAIMSAVNQDDNLTSKIAATPVKIDGKSLTATGYSKDEVESGGASH